MMIKTKSKQELIELVYKNDVINQNLTECLNDQHSMITDISDLYESHLIKTNRIQRFISFILIPFKVFNILNKYNKYFYTYQINKVNMNEQQVLEALDYINDYENKLSSPISYMNYIERVTGVNICKTCGNTNSRLHNDFQRRILTIIVKDFPYLLMKIELKSSKYGSDNFNSTIPTYTFHYLNNLLSKMAQDVKNFKNRGLHKSSEEIQVDHDTLVAYIKERKRSSLVNKQGNKDVKPKSDAIVPSKEESPLKQLKTAPEPSNDEASIKGVIQSVKPINDVIIPENVNDGLEANVEPSKDEVSPLDKGLVMQKEGIHLKTIAKEIGLPYKGLSKLLKDHKA